MLAFVIQNHSHPRERGPRKNLSVVFLVMAPPSQELGPPINPERLMTREATSPTVRVPNSAPLHGYPRGIRNCTDSQQCGNEEPILPENQNGGGSKGVGAIRPSRNLPRCKKIPLVRQLRGEDYRIISSRNS
jgi:hypothetical protein